MQKSMENNSAAEHYFCFTKTTPAPAARLLCFHCAGGSPYAYAPWTKYISDQMEVYPFQMAGRCGRIQEPYSRSLETAAQEAAAVIQSYADQKILFTGHSMGGVVAYHTAYLLQTQYGISVDRLFLTASAPDMSHTLRTLYADSIHAEDAAFCDMLLQFGAIDRKVLKVSNFQEQFLPERFISTAVAETTFLSNSTCRKFAKPSIPAFEKGEYYGTVRKNHFHHQKSRRSHH